MPGSRHDIVPVFQLYGETSPWPTPDLLHCESIPQRSQLHDWEIQTHSHSDLVQLLYVQSGQATLQVEGVTRQASSAVLQIIAPLSVHSFRFAPDIEGYVLSLAQPLVDRLNAMLVLPGAHQAQFQEVDDQARESLDVLFGAINDEYRQARAGRDAMLQALVTQLWIWLARRSAEPVVAPAAAPDAGRARLQAFTRLFGLHYRQHLPIEHYAVQLNVSAAYLNSLCRRLTGHSALQLINQRLVLEAKRELVYTTLTVNQVSDRLGFSDPAYFSRFFKRATGQSPRRFRVAR